MVDVRAFDSLSEAELEWRRFEELGAALPYQLFDWVAAWDASNSGAAIEPRPVAVFTDDGEPLFFLPIGVVASQRHRVTVRNAVWLAAAFADQQAPIVTEAGSALTEREFAEIWRQVGEALDNVDLIELRRQPTTIYGAPNPLLLLGLEPHAFAFSTRLHGPWADYHASKIGTRQRKNTRRKIRRLAEHGDTEFRVVEDPEEMDRSIEAMMEQKRARYQQTGRDDFFADEGNARFHRTLIERRPDISHMMTCTVDGAIVATDFGVLHRSTLHGLMSTFDLEWEGFSPGRLLLTQVLEWSCDHGVEVYDFSIGEEPYKQDWCEITTTLHRGSVAMTARGRAVLMPGRIRRFLGDRSTDLRRAVGNRRKSSRLPD